MNRGLARKKTNRLLRLFLRVSAALRKKCMLAACLLFGTLFTTTLFATEPPITDVVFAPDDVGLAATV